MSNVIMVMMGSALRLDFKNIVSILSVELNPFSPKRKRPLVTRHMKYTKEVLKGKYFQIGDYTYGIPNVSPSLGSKLKIGKFCSIAWDVSIELRGTHRTNHVTTYPFHVFPDDWPVAKYQKEEDVGAISKGDVVIGNDVNFGFGVTVLSGVRIGDGAVIGAKSVVTKDVEPYSIVAGNPARLIRKRFDDETIQKLLGIRWWDWPIEKINENLDTICSSNVSKMLELQ
ncbi:MAG: CatB-related O-acetyltransferase [Nitrososphaerota archaeon]|nr:CatB-related O-acetyltransferase [Nitrososphaerota archaeon]